MNLPIMFWNDIKRWEYELNNDNTVFQESIRVKSILDKGYSVGTNYLSFNKIENVINFDDIFIHKITKKISM